MITQSDKLERDGVIFSNGDQWCRRCPKCNKIIPHEGNNARYNCAYNALKLLACRSCCGKARPRTNGKWIRHTIKNPDVWYKDNKWWRICPKCKKEVGYDREDSARGSNRVGSICMKCFNHGKKFYDHTPKPKVEPKIEPMVDISTCIIGSEEWFNAVRIGILHGISTTTLSEDDQETFWKIMNARQPKRRKSAEEIFNPISRLGTPS